MRASLKPFLVVLGLIVAAGLGAFISHLPGSSTNLSGAAELRLVEAKVSKHYLLPTNEVPALATVTNQSKLTTPFLKNARNGDEILIYEKNKVAIVYRPSIDRIVAVGPVNIQPADSSNPLGHSQ